MRRVFVIGLAVAALGATPNALANPPALFGTAVEGTYEYREVSVVSGTRFPHRYQWSQSFSAATIKQGEPLEFRALEKIEAWRWCFSYDEYDIRQTGLNFRVAYTPRGRAHPVTGEGIRLSETPYRARAWRELSNCAPSCPNGIGTCPYYGTQYHELTGTVPGSETATLKPGCYLLETYWEYGPSPPPVGIEQSESGSLPRFCVQAARNGTRNADATRTRNTPEPTTNPSSASQLGSSARRARHNRANRTSPRLSRNCRITRPAPVRRLRQQRPHTPTNRRHLGNQSARQDQPTIGRKPRLPNRIRHLPATPERTRRPTLLHRRLGPSRQPERKKLRTPDRHLAQSSARD